ncbi:MAG: hypothetical protein Pg6C_00750 [Treponemataceae bacterium]|nr:MAG: hypothetical protein Pg6C_00750 [Treponemataceae bacterium]
MNPLRRHGWIYLFQAHRSHTTHSARATASILIFFTFQALSAKNKFGFNVTLAELQIYDVFPRRWSFFPVEIVYNFVNYDELLWVYFFAGGKILFRPIPDEQTVLDEAAEKNKPAEARVVGTIGARFSLIPRTEPAALLRRHSVNVFLEYSSLNTFSVGISLPASGLSYLIADWLEILNSEIESLIPPKTPPEKKPNENSPEKKPRQNKEGNNR